MVEADGPPLVRRGEFCETTATTLPGASDEVRTALQQRPDQRHPALSPRPDAWGSFPGRRGCGAGGSSRPGAQKKADPDCWWGRAGQDPGEEGVPRSAVLSPKRRSAIDRVPAPRGKDLTPTDVDEGRATSQGRLRADTASATWRRSRRKQWDRFFSAGVGNAVNVPRADLRRSLLFGRQRSRSRTRRFLRLT